MLIVVGGQARKVGKTSLICDIISETRAANWTAIKLTPHLHAGDAPSLTPDSERYLASGAARSFWLTGPPDQLPAILSEGGNIIIESNSVLDLVTPDLCLIVLDPAIADFKPSAHQFLRRADAILHPGSDKAAVIQLVKLKLSSLPADNTSE